MLVPAAMALSAAAPGAADWRLFYQPENEVGTPADYDAASVTRRGERVRVRYRWTGATSGVPVYRTVRRVELDCRERRIGVFESLIYDGVYQLMGRQPHRERRPAGTGPIEAGSMEDALARRLCGEGPL